MPRLNYNGVVVEVSDETAALLSADYKPVVEKRASAKTTAKKSSSRKSEK